MGGWLAAGVLLASTWYYRQAVIAGKAEADASAAGNPISIIKKSEGRPAPINVSASLVETDDTGANQTPDTDKLIARIADLEKELSQQRQQNRELKAEAGPLKSDRNDMRGNGRGAGRMGDVTAWRSDDPAVREQFHQRMQEMTSRMQNTLSEQAEFFSSLDESLMTPGQRDNHRKLLELLKNTNQAMADASQNPDDATANPVIRQQLFQNMGTIRNLLETERQAAYMEFAQKMNFSAVEAKQFSDYLNYVTQMTSVGGLMRPRGFGNPGQAGGTTGTTPP